MLNSTQDEVEVETKVELGKSWLNSLTDLDRSQCRTIFLSDDLSYPYCLSVMIMQVVVSCNPPHNMKYNQDEKSTHRIIAHQSS